MCSNVMTSDVYENIIKPDARKSGTIFQSKKHLNAMIGTVITWKTF